MKRRTFLQSALWAGSGLVTSSGVADVRFSGLMKTADLDDLVDVTSVPGAATVGVIGARKVSKFLGVRSVSTRERIQEDTIFPAASLSKVVFAWGVRELVRNGKIEWKKPLNEYTNLGLEGAARTITAEHVLSHTTGLPNWRFEESTALTSSFEPGTKWSYSGEGFYLLQRVVEKVLSESAASYMSRAVLPGLGITSGSFAWTPKLKSTAVVGHDSHDAVLEKSVLFYEEKNFAILDHAGLDPHTATIDQIIEAYKRNKTPALPILMSPNMAGSLWLTPTEYSKFAEAVMKDAVVNADDYKARIEVKKRLSWTLGWGVDRTFSEPALFAFGDGPGIKNFVWIQPQNKIAIAVFTNGEHGAVLYGGILRQLLGVDTMALYWV
jgi:CubicO group peptidase (beta-lactamase class C family)